MCLGCRRCYPPHDRSAPCPCIVRCGSPNCTAERRLPDLRVPPRVDDRPLQGEPGRWQIGGGYGHGAADAQNTT